MTLTTRSRAAVAVLFAALVLALAGCGSSSSSSSSSSSASSSQSTTHVRAAKTKFVLHAGLAFGAFHRYIYKPAKRGDFAHPLSHKLTAIKAAAAAAFVYHELKLALHDAQSSPTLSKLVAPLTALQTRFASAGSRIKGGQFPASEATQTNSQISGIKGQSASAGQPITEQSPSHV